MMRPRNSAKTLLRTFFASAGVFNRSASVQIVDRYQVVIAW